MGFGYRKVRFRYSIGLDWGGIECGMWYGIEYGIWHGIEFRKNQTFQVKTKIGEYRKTELLLVDTMTNSIFYQNHDMIL